MSRTWQDNAAEFAALDVGEGWPFARLVACSVERGAGQGSTKPRNDRYKVSADTFAREAGTSAPRVLRYLETWHKASRRGWVPAASTLTPDMAHTIMDPEQPWFSKDGGLYDATKAGGPARPENARAEVVAQIVEKRGAVAVVEHLTPEQRRDVLRAIHAQHDAEHPAKIQPQERPDVGS